jgi:hypothetical protein
VGRMTISVVLVLACVSIGFAQGRGNGQGRQSSSVGDKVRSVAPPSQAVFTTTERTLIKRWFSTNYNNLPPGLAKRDRLPPGLEKQLRERGTLPPGLQKKVQPLPLDLERQLSVLPTGYRRVVIGNNVILMNPKTALIYDIARAVIP